MTKRGAKAIWCLAFVVVGLMGIGLGRLSGVQPVPMDLWCDGESARQVQINARPAWFMTRFSLDLSPSGLSHLRMAARLIDADSKAEIGVMNRYSAFRVKKNGSRLMVEVDSSLKSNADNLSPEQLSSLDLYIFQPKSSLSYWMQPLGETRYTIDVGENLFVLCSRRSPLKPWARVVMVLARSSRL
ncbi:MULTISPECIES: hypothetical protein [unclassified Pseudomonas]|uniref:hypothetical protein n=1 Tax=unclassified Pseudomonas TaxID=196821 RepID=UPI000BA2CAD5|nr:MULTISPECIES: hypothetical protein [unclassified Pseudomonas]